MVLSGPTGSGKTYFVKNVLEKNLIHPKPDRIVWLYKRWQPLYDEMKRTVKPKIEFIQGIPDDLDSDDFFDPSKHNVIVLDDLMSVAAKDPHIAELFTEGSHHRNLSVLSLQQNVFPNGPHGVTMRRNGHYYVLFKSPADKRQIMTLASQMYPHKSDNFMRAYDQATLKPHGYLLIDLKQSTPEDQRLKTDIFNKVGEGMPQDIPPGLPPDSTKERVLDFNTLEVTGEGEESESSQDSFHNSWDDGRIALGLWLANPDPEADPPPGWKDKIQFYWQEKGLGGIQNPQALAYLAHQLDLPCPYWYDCGEGCPPKARGYYVSQCPACKYVDFYVKQKGPIQSVKCKGEDDFIFETGWHKCLYLVDVCKPGKHVFVCDHRNPKHKNNYPEVEVKADNFL
jgi:hypothetical protein